MVSPALLQATTMAIASNGSRVVASSGAMVAAVYALRRSRAELLRHHQIDVTKGKRLVRLEMMGFRVAHTLCTWPLLPRGLRACIRALTYKKKRTLSRAYASLPRFFRDYVVLLPAK